MVSNNYSSFVKTILRNSFSDSANKETSFVESIKCLFLPSQVKLIDGKCWQISGSSTLTEFYTYCETDRVSVCNLWQRRTCSRILDLQQFCYRANVVEYHGFGHESKISALNVRLTNGNYQLWKLLIRTIFVYKFLYKYTKEYTFRTSA